MKLHSLSSPPVAPDPDSCGPWGGDKWFPHWEIFIIDWLTCRQEEEQEQENSHGLTDVQTYEVVYLVPCSNSGGFSQTAPVLVACFTWAEVVRHLVLPVAAVTDAVTDQVRADADVGVALEAADTAEALGVLESRNDEAEAVAGGSPAVGVVAQGDVVGPGDDEPVAAHRAGLGVTGDVGLAIQTVSRENGEVGRGGLLTLQAPATWAPS